VLLSGLELASGAVTLTKSVLDSFGANVNVVVLVMTGSVVAEPLYAAAAHAGLDTLLVKKAPTKEIVS
jgi:hypothetical protein